MESKNVEETLKKMGVVLEKVVQKVDELEKRVINLEQKVLAEKGKELKESERTSFSQPQQSNLQSSGSGFGTGFLSSLLGSFAGMSLFSLLFNNNVSSHEFAENVGVSDTELSEIDHKLEEIDQKLDEIDEKIDSIDDVDTENLADLDEEPFRQDTGFDDSFGFGDDFDIDV